MFCGHERGSELPEEKSSPTSDPGQPWGTRVVGDGFLRVVSASTEAVTGSGTQAVPVAVVEGMSAVVSLVS